MSHNGHNPHDLAAARIVAGAMEASKLPPAAAKAVFRALNAAGVPPPEPTEDDKNRALTALVDRMPTAATPAPTGEDPMQRMVELAAGRLALQQDAVILALVRERLVIPVADLEQLRGRLEGFDYAHGEFRDWELDGVPLVRFWPPEVAFEDGQMLVNLRYRTGT